MSYIPESDSQYILNDSGVTINPATDETVLLLRRMLKLMEPLAVQDSLQRQRVNVEAITTVTVGNVTNISNITALGGVDPRFQFIDTARNAFANGIRQNLNFS
jgi:hypothetical protein